MKKWLLCSAAILCAFPLTVSADPKASLIEYLENLQDFGVTFEQHTADVYGETQLLSTGRFYLQRPDHFYWYQKKPDEIYYVSDGNLYWEYDVLLEQVIIKDALKVLRDSPVQWLLSPPAEWLADFSVEVVNQGDDGCIVDKCFLLTPVDDSLFISSALLGFIEDKISQISFNDNLEQTTDILFSTFEANLTPPNGFELDLPENIEILDLT